MPALKGLGDGSSDIPRAGFRNILTYKMLWPVTPAPGFADSRIASWLDVLSRACQQNARRRVFRESVVVWGTNFELRCRDPPVSCLTVSNAWSAGVSCPTL